MLQITLGKSGHRRLRQFRQTVDLDLGRTRPAQRVWSEPCPADRWMGVRVI